MKRAGTVRRVQNKWFIDMSPNRAWVQVVRGECRLTFYGVILPGGSHEDAMRDAIKAIAVWKEKASELQPRDE